MKPLQEMMHPWPGLRGPGRPGTKFDFAKIGVHHEKVDKELRYRKSNFEDLREKAEALVSDNVAFAVPKINITID